MTKVALSRALELRLWSSPDNLNGTFSVQNTDDPKWRDRHWLQGLCSGHQRIGSLQRVNQALQHSATSLASERGHCFIQCLSQRALAAIVHQIIVVNRVNGKSSQITKKSIFCLNTPAKFFQSQILIIWIYLDFHTHYVIECNPGRISECVGGSQILITLHRPPSFLNDSTYLFIII